MSGPLRARRAARAQDGVGLHQRGWSGVRSLASLALVFTACAQGTVRYPSAAPQATLAFPAADWGRAHASDPAANAAGASQDSAPATSAPSAPAASPLVAVLEFHNRLQGDDRNALDANYLANAVRAAVKRARPASRLMTQENIQVLLASAHKTLEECQGECEVDTGRLLGADLIVTGDMLRVGSHLKLDLRMHDTRSGQLVAGSTAGGSSVDELDADLPRAVNDLVAALR